MSETLCTLRTKGGGGGKYTETSLWTNSAPTNSFSAQDITLSEGMSDFKYLKIRCAISTSSSTGIFEDIVLVTELNNTSSATTNNTRDRLILGLGRDTYDYERAYYRVSDTSIHFNPAYQSGTSTTTATKIIPLEILGLNELDHGKRFDETTLWTNSASSSTFAAQEITLSDDIDNYDYIAIDYKYANNTSDGDYSTVMQTPANIKKGGYNTSVTRCGLALDYISGGNANYARQVFYVSDTKLRFDIGRQFGGTNSSNANAIPLRVVGCKFR